jgi:hypothetical protein
MCYHWKETSKRNELRNPLDGKTDKSRAGLSRCQQTCGQKLPARWRVVQRPCLCVVACSHGDWEFSLANEQQKPKPLAGCSGHELLPGHANLGCSCCFQNLGCELVRFEMPEILLTTRLVLRQSKDLWKSSRTRGKNGPI